MKTTCFFLLLLLAGCTSTTNQGGTIDIAGAMETVAEKPLNLADYFSKIE